MPLSRTNDLEILRRIDPVEREKVLTGILDRRMKQIAKLQSKHQILHQCQKLLIQKAIQYMNQLDQADVKFLKQSEMYTQKLQAKQNVLMEKEKSLEQVRSDLWLRVEEISQMKQLIKEKNNRLQNLGIANESLQSANLKEAEILDTNKKALKQCRDETVSLRQKVELLTQEVAYMDGQINMYVEEIKLLTNKLKTEGTKYWNQSNSQTEELQLVQRKMNRQLFQKDKVIEDLQLTVSTIKETQSFALENKSSFKKVLCTHKLSGTTIGNQGFLNISRVSSGTEVFNGSKSERQSEKFLEQEQVQVQVYKIEVPKQDCRVDSRQTISRTPGRPTSSRHCKIGNRIPTDKQEIRKEHNFKNGGSPSHKDSQVKSLSQLYQFYQQLKKVTSLRFDLCELQKAELLATLQQRPPREQDMMRISELEVENHRLLTANHEAVERAEYAFEAMRLCKQELRLVIENTPMEIYPKRASSKTMYRSSSKALGNSSSLNTPNCKRKYRKMADSFGKHQDQTAVLGCLRDIYASGQLNLNKYVKMTSSSFSNVETHKARKSIR